MKTTLDIKVHETRVKLIHVCFFSQKRIVCRPIENGMDSLPSVERIMIWSEYEAYLLQVKQIGMSACGQTAVLNLLVSPSACMHTGCYS